MTTKPVNKKQFWTWAFYSVDRNDLEHIINTATIAGKNIYTCRYKIGAHTHLEDHQFLPLKFHWHDIGNFFTIIISTRMSNVCIVGWQIQLVETLILIVVSFSESKRKILDLLLAICRLSSASIRLHTQHDSTLTGKSL